ncbi:MAG: hypothetical protein ACE5KM_10165 [Planctomycetaceae bacterium]
MSAVLWLAYERPPHPDAVRAAAREADLCFLLPLLASPYWERCRYAVQFANFLRSRNRRSEFLEDSVTCRLPGGVCHFVNWRLAKWLSHVLPASDAVIARTMTQIRTWLHHNREQDILRPFGNGTQSSRSATPRSGVAQTGCRGGTPLGATNRT